MTKLSDGVLCSEYSVKVMFVVGQVIAILFKIKEVREDKQKVDEILDKAIEILKEFRETGNAPGLKNVLG